MDFYNDTFNMVRYGDWLFFNIVLENFIIPILVVITCLVVIIFQIATYIRLGKLNNKKNN